MSRAPLDLEQPRVRREGGGKTSLEKELPVRAHYESGLGLMLLAADTHVHAYPQFDLGLLLRQSIQNLAQVEEGAVPAIILTERRDCHVFAGLLDGSILVPPSCTVQSGSESGSIWIDAAPAQRLLVVGGRQIVTFERLEVLCLTVDADIPDGQPIEDTLDRVREMGGIPVLPWAAGKWTGERARVIRRLMDGPTVGGILLADSSLRPRGWPRPTMFQHADAMGIGVLAGSDPLPLPGQEAFSGTYGIVIENGFDPERPIASLRQALSAGVSNWRIAGRRRSVPRVAVDLLALRRTRQRES